MIYIVIAMFLLLVEMLCWAIRTSLLEHRRWVRWISDHLPPDPVFVLLRLFGRTLHRKKTGKFTEAGRALVKKILAWWEESRWTDHVDVLLRAAEIGNSIW